MRKIMKLIIFICITTFVAYLKVFPQDGVVIIDPDYLKKILSEEITVEFDFLLIDIRDDILDISSGIIASDNCKPYHLPYNSEGLKGENKEKLPKDVPIIIYCKSGVKAREAGEYLWNEGFRFIGAMEGGVSLYTQLGGKLRDSSEFKPLDKLPEPSYSGKKANVYYERKYRSKNYTIQPKEKDISTKYYNLQGRILPSLSNNRSPVYILERIGRENSRGKIKGLHRLLVIEEK